MSSVIKIETAAKGARERKWRRRKQESREILFGRRDDPIRLSVRLSYNFYATTTDTVKVTGNQNGWHQLFYIWAEVSYVEIYFFGKCFTKQEKSKHDHESIYLSGSPHSFSVASFYRALLWHDARGRGAGAPLHNRPPSPPFSQAHNSCLGLIGCLSRLHISSFSNQRRAPFLGSRPTIQIFTESGGRTQHGIFCAITRTRTPLTVVFRWKKSVVIWLKRCTL